MNKIRISKTTKLMALLLFLISSSVQAMPKVNFIDQSNAVNSDIPVTFGQVFAVGDVPAGMSVNLVAGATSLATQVDMKATHPDGSLRHAVISTILPALSAGQNLTTELAVVNPNTTGSAINLTDLLATNFTGEVNLNVAGTEYTANIRDLLEDIGTGTDVIFKNSFDNNTRSQIWLSGSEVTEWIVSAPFKTAGGTEHPHLTARFNVRAYAGFDSVRVDVIVENNWTYVPEPQNFVYDVAVSLCGNNVYSKTDLTHYHHARWRKTFWCGNEPAVHIKHDIDYLIDSYAVPNYDRSLVIPEVDLADMETNWTGAKIEPMGIGAALAYMPAGGARPDIGPLPRWTARYLLSQDIRAKTSMLGTANLAGSWSIHYRDKSTDLPISIDDYPYMTLLCNYNNTLNPNTGEYEAFPKFGGDSTTPYVADDAHQPNLVYLPYLVTGDYYLLEELHFWANYNMLRACPGDAARGYKSGLTKWAQLRGQAWTLRTLGEVAFITPDNHAYKPYFIEKLDNNLTWYNDNYTHNSSANNLGILTNGRIGNPRRQQPWQDDFFTWSIGHLAEMGFTKAAELLIWKSKAAIGRMTDSEYCWIFGSKSPLYVRDDINSPVYDSFGEIYQNSVEPQYLTMTCASQEMADALGVPLGSMFRHPGSATGYPANMQPALAAAVDSGSPNATAAWIIFEGRSVKPAGNNSYDRYPNYAIIPRNF